MTISKHYDSARVLWLAACLALALPSCGTEATGNGGTGGDRDTEAPGNDVQVAPDVDEPDTSGDGEDVQVEDDGELRLLAITPAFGPTQGNDVVTLSGTGFVDGDLQVYFGPSVAAEVFVLSSTRLTCITPPGPPGLVDVRITRPSTDASAEILLGYAYQSPVVITAIDPAEGHLLGGEPVTVKGTGFLRGVDSVLFGGRAAIDVVVIDDRTIQLTTPPGEVEGPADVRVTTPGGVGLGTGGFNYYATPRLDRAYPGSGSVAGGTEVRLEGAGFTADSKVTFGGVAAAKVDVLGPSVIVAISPAGSVGSVDLAVATSRGPAVLDAGFTYIDPASVPVVGLVGIQPNVGSVLGGQTVDLVAYGLPATPEELTVRFDGVPATVTAVQPGKLRATVVTPPGELGPADVAIETPGGNAVLSLGFLYEAALTVTATSPAEGPASGGTTITITGVGFTAAASVRVGALPCTNVTLVDATTLTCTTAAGSPGGADIRVTVGGKTAVLAAGFNYTTDGIALYAVNPDVGSQAGGTYVTLVGASFIAPLEVTFAGYEATHVTVVSPTEITCRTPPGAVGTVDVQVVPASGDEATLLQAFTYYDPASLFGGTWGPDVVGTLNVTVLDAGNGDRLPDAYVILATDADTPYQGYTSLSGQITFSGPDVLGTQMVSASKEGYESSSVIEFDATNVTLALTPLPPPSSGPPPPGATVSGRVFGLGKYVLVPPPDCLFNELPDGQCESCVTDGDCLSTAPNCSTLAEGSYCTANCSSDSECGDGYLCSALAGAPGPQCVPAPGKRQARCFLSAGSIFSPLPTDETPNIVQDDGTYLIGSRLGEVAIICLGGFVDESNPDTTSNFTPVVAGVARHVNVVPGENTGVDVTLIHPLTRSIKIRLDDPPYRPEIN
ncbi:MAG: IPT/TIG domain-containing protein, partial [Myxococcales bacterium]|nr:IPT/TIG domain-containing protein [Myxococcales bacterium]